MNPNSMVLAEIPMGTDLYAVILPHMRLIRCTKKYAQECGLRIVSFEITK